MKGTLLELLEPRGFWKDRKTAFVFWDGEKWPWYLGKLSYRQLRKKAKCFATALLNELDLVPGERLAIMLPNTLQFPTVYFGAMMAGVVVVPINPRYTETPNEILKILKDSGAKTVVILDRFLPALEAIKNEIKLRHIVVTTQADSLPLLKKIVYCVKTRRNKNKYLRYAWLVSARRFKAVRLPNIRPTDVALILYTSGTTGAPKGVIMTHKALLENAKACREYLLRMGLRDNEEIFLATVPYFHILGLSALLHTAFLVRARIVLVPDPRKIPQIMKAIRFTKATAFAGTPGHYEATAKILAVSTEKYDLSSVKLWINGGAKLHRIHREKFERLVGKKIRNGYGMSELGIVSCQLLDDEEEDSIGEPFEKVETVIFNPDKNGTGELWVRSPGAMKGYWKQPETTSETINPDGWLCTGDFAQYSEKAGVLRILLKGRKKYLIKTRTGENIDPLEIEKVLMAHSDIIEAAVVGVSDEKHGERVRACVVLRDPKTSCAGVFKKKIFEHCRNHLANFKIPQEIICVKEIEKNAVGKILYEKLKELKASA
ncbi:hypothetical protein A3G55_04190 [Candidatus Giovannonibacteria bacterium RIFCSPLOWO2_12_FULL_44_25]|nr:MAG: hypothetical protein UW53_C0005G0005 [Candidatus Giovannonibacteria bacterium GW2011_GWA1_44_25]KKU12011.1 MAG: hypothetical protein UX18_C0034G0005 [Candidatus Azambacteria bacterium GW2011_GWC2_45_7b]KKU29763.1 MAG: hypothetical protein UX43_C0006G0038 [Candidatus Giovannonibacteria bacterium GW2011_GWB1_46_20]OGF49133.1 MAG: hypothetical protein A2120_01570 [Candidatus Giovannonibacteria bacterium GWA2_45_15]OGF60891.1 MAG: hypothetical protein A2656_02845 [Candidatus Giovannonibacte